MSASAGGGGGLGRMCGFALEMKMIKLRSSDELSRHDIANVGKLSTFEQDGCAGKDGAAELRNGLRGDICRFVVGSCTSLINWTWLGGSRPVLQAVRE
jgi:hypothetical protein